MQLEQPPIPNPAFKVPKSAPMTFKNSLKNIGFSGSNKNYQTSSPVILYKRLNLQILGFESPLVSIFLSSYIFKTSLFFSATEIILTQNLEF